ncbi:MAG: imelysin family protein [Myxococcota bacterium]
MVTTAGEPTPTRAHRWWALGLCTVALLGKGCKESDSMGSTDPGEFDHAAMLENLSTNVIQPAHDEFLSAADELVAAVTAWQASPSGDTLETARQAWRNAMRVWSRVEVMQIGPAAGPSAPGAESLRDEIYSWATVSACSVDQQVVSGSYTDPDFIDNKLVNVYGLDALEYLLFYEDTDNQCPSASSINRDGLWDELDADTVTERRAAYAVVVAEGVATRAQTLADRWDPDGGDFGGLLATAGTNDDSVYENVGQAVDAVYAGMFYVDTQVKDAKLGRTSGRWSECANEECGPQFVESAWAQHSLENVVGNLEGLQLLYHGGAPEGDGVGFDDFLRAKEADSLATQIGDAIAQALTVAEGTSAPLVDTLSDDLAQVEGLYDAVKAITDPLKNEFVIVLQVTIPSVGKGDTD